MLLYPKKTSTALLSLCLLASMHLGTHSPVTGELVGEVVHKILSGQGSWVAMKSQVILNFQNKDLQKATCQGRLVYHRLDEKMILECFGEKSSLVFTFRTNDTRFDLYLPDQNTVFSGNIFDLESSESFQSHLKPLALYRALKIMTIDSKNTQLLSSDSKMLVLETFGRPFGKSMLNRKVFVTQEGLVLKEEYYPPHGGGPTLIERFRYQNFQSSLQQNIHFAREILITDNQDLRQSHGSQTSIQFDNIEFLSNINSEEWTLRLPAQTKQISLPSKAIS